MLFFLRSWCYFNSSAVALLVGISKFKHIYEAELQLSTRFPFHCQDRFIFRFKWGSENEVEKSIEKVVPKGSRMDPKSRPKSTERVFWRGSKEGPKKGTLPSPGPGQVRFSCYLLHFSKVRGLRKGSFLGTFWSRFWRKNHENRVPEQHQKMCWN